MAISTFVYAYSLAIDFSAGIREELLHRQIQDASLGQPLQGISRRGDAVEIAFGAKLVSKVPLDALVAAHAPGNFLFEPRFLEEEYQANRLARRTWFAFKLEAVYRYKVEETLFTYQSTRLTREVWSAYNSDGTVQRTRTWDYTTTVEGLQTIVRKEEV